MKCHVCNSVISDGAVFCPSCGMQQPGTTEPQDYQYAAFISYRHFPR
ncbi:MAG: zinc-ribbon domain-containing protein, partial [Eggerthellaceae bacterium]|nr:zinc-ribbon domain-containing protein [Eggerthellaceae bacterium]